MRKPGESDKDRRRRIAALAIALEASVEDVEGEVQAAATAAAAPRESWFAGEVNRHWLNLETTARLGAALGILSVSDLFASRPAPAQEQLLQRALSVAEAHFETINDHPADLAAGIAAAATAGVEAALATYADLVVEAAGRPGDNVVPFGAARGRGSRP